VRRRRRLTMGGQSVNLGEAFEPAPRSFFPRVERRSVDPLQTEQLCANRFGKE
jgi:hypothetical protein